MAESNNDSNKALASVLAIVAVVGGIAAVVRPMHQQMDGLQQEIQVLHEKMREDDARERHGAFALGSLQAQMADVKEQVEKLESK